MSLILRSEYILQVVLVLYHVDLEFVMLTTHATAYMWQVVNTPSNQIASHSNFVEESNRSMFDQNFREDIYSAESILRGWP